MSVVNLIMVIVYLMSELKLLKLQLLLLLIEWCHVMITVRTSYQGHSLTFDRGYSYQTDSLKNS